MYWYALRLFGLKQLSWNKQFEANVWCRGPNSPYTTARVEELCNGGKLIEFGAGEGNLPHLLKKECFSEYVGIDISSVAIERARRKALDAGLNNCQFEQGDMAKWKGAQSVSLIMLSECLYYLNSAEVEKFLLNAMASLTPNGSILVVVHSATKHANTLDICRRVCNVLDERYVNNSRIYLTLGRKSA
jgi:trans-aconitate methyltransferase